ncbi:Flp/Fap pilin component [Marinomonas aquimarina]|uniref:Flp/Fap pilin component n=1 Tax=Marinomonas aquimarina TaxID=295068 RepID=A0A1A8T2H3_9GAMM|nr:Flp family type IVb pilin [Marinomonas aquimarina]SBS25918.1 Flp/Fap pilin component [Marinomonas aquimarina]
MFTKLYVQACTFFTDRKGVTAIEYAVLAVAVALTVYFVFGGEDSALTTTLQGALSKVTSTVNGLGS